MKKIFLGLCLLLVSAFANAQLDSVIAEKYYVSNAADSVGALTFGDNLPVGSITWRFYVDMRPGCKFQAAYGTLSPAHTLTFSTTTSFYNNTDRGAEIPSYSKANAATHTTMLDSWFSVGAATSSLFGILKTEDGAAGGTNVVNAQGILANNDASAGIPLTTQDGIWQAAFAPQAATFVGYSPTPDFSSGPSVSLINITNGSWASLNGSVGPTATNRVLIAQLTTKGVLHYELNLQIKDTITNIVYNYVALNPVGSEISVPSLQGNLNLPNALPTVSIVAPANNATYITGATVNIKAKADDPDGTISKVDFKVDGTIVGTITVPTSAPDTFQYNWTSTVGTHILTAVATDNLGGVTTSAPITIIVGNNIPPIVSITTPSNGSVVTAPVVVPFIANATDPDGTVSLVEFYVNGVLVGSSSSGPNFTYNWTSVIGTATITARATDNNGGQTTSSPVTITVLDPAGPPYRVVGSSNSCQPSTMCIPISVRTNVANVIGYDIVMHYNTSKVSPTGNITVSPNLVNPTYVDHVSSNDAANGLFSFSLFFNALAPSGTFFTGTGNVCCVEFSKLPGFAANDSVTFSVTSLQESYITGVLPQLCDSGKYKTAGDSTFTAKLKFWSNNSPIVYDAANSASHLITNIYGNNSSCNSPSASVFHPDTAGKFNYNVVNGLDLNLNKDILGTTSVQPVINGFDAFLARRVLINDVTFTPSIYQIMAMDVNLDGVVSAGDVSQMNQRTVLIIPEFKQAWNYNVLGVSDGRPSKDWVFVDSSVTLNTNLAYRISTTYPANDGIGYSKARVPVTPFCLPVPITSIGGTCPVITGETYVGILVGDVNGSYASVSNALFRQDSNNKVVFDLSKAVISGNYIDVPVSVLSFDNVNSLDFAMQLNEDNLAFNSVVDHTSYLQSLANYNADDNTLRFTSNSLQNYSVNRPVISVRFEMKAGQIKESDLNSITAYVNGEKVGAEVLGANSISTSEALISIYPNPTNSIVNIEVSENANIQLMSLDGRQVILEKIVNANEKQELSIQNLANGIYMMKIYNDNFVTIKKVVVQK